MDVGVTVPTHPVAATPVTRASTRACYALGVTGRTK